MFAKLAEAQGCARKLWIGYGEIPSPAGKRGGAGAAKFRPGSPPGRGETQGLRRLGYLQMGIFHRRQRRLRGEAEISPKFLLGSIANSYAEAGCAGAVACQRDKNIAKLLKIAAGKFVAGGRPRRRCRRI
jgi:hypothetical protein